MPSSIAGPTTGRIMRNAVTALAIAWSMRVIGLLSVFVLARMLAPRDFGVMALAMSAAALVDVFAALGLRQALLRIPQPDRAHYDTAWTIQVMLLTFLAILLAALAPLASWFYHEPALAAVIVVLASRFVFYGVVNIGTIDFDRHLQLGRDLQLRIAVRLGTFATTVGAAVVLRNYWALVIGAVVQALLHAVGSYVVHPFRPRFSLAKRAELLGVSLWMFLSSASHTMFREIEQLVAGRIASMQVVGFYSVTKGLSSIFTEEIATALNRVTFVITARDGRTLSEQPERLSVMLGSYAMIAALFGLGLASTAGDACVVLLGPKWAGAAPYLRFVGPGAACFAVYKLVISTLQACGEARQGAYLSMSGALFLVGAVTLTAMAGGDALGIARAGAWSTATLLVTGLVYLAIKSRTSALAMLLSVGRPFTAGLVMFVAVSSIPDVISLPLAQLTIEAACGAAVFFVGNAALWWASGQPAGAEAKLFQLLAAGVARSFGRPSDERA